MRPAAGALWAALFAAGACRAGTSDNINTSGGGATVGGGGTSSGPSSTGGSTSPRSGGALTPSTLTPGNANGGSTSDPNTTPAGASRCAATAPAGTVCDGFETATVGGPPDAQLWTIATAKPTSTVTVETTRAVRGRQSVHLHTANGGYERAVIVNTSLFPAANNTFWGRAFFYVVGPVPQAHFTLIAGADVPKSAGSQPTWVRYGGQFGHFIANWFGNDAAQHAGVNVGGQWTMASLVPADKWVCLEWQFKGDTNELHLWQDGAAIERLSIVGTASDSPGTTWTAPTYGQVQLGWEIYGNGGTDAALTGYDVFVDEVALGPARITCDG